MKEREKIEALKHEITKTKKLLDGLVNAEVWAIKDWVDATMTLAMKIGKERWPKVVKFCKVLSTYSSVSRNFPRKLV